MPTCRPRALRIVPIDAAVIPFPREDTTPPVTNTNLAMGSLPRGFRQSTSTPGRGVNRCSVRARSGAARLEDEDTGVVRAGHGAVEVELRQRLVAVLGEPHLLGEGVDGLVVAAAGRVRRAITHRHADRWG